MVSSHTIQKSIQDGEFVNVTLADEIHWIQKIINTWHTKCLVQKIYQIKFLMKYAFPWFRSGKKRPFSASKNSGNGLEPVAEELSWQHSDPNFKLAKLSENELTPDNGN